MLYIECLLLLGFRHSVQSMSLVGYQPHVSSSLMRRLTTHTEGQGEEHWLIYCLIFAFVFFKRMQKIQFDIIE